MKVLYLAYWGLNEALTASTVLPHLRTLSGYREVDTIVYCSIERRGQVSPLKMPKVKHIQLVSHERKYVLMTKVENYFIFFSRLKQICVDEHVDMIICRSSLAGSFGHRLNKSLNIPYVVESFEPHGEYMVESNIWGRFDIRTIVQTIHEDQQKKSSRYLIPVSFNYAERLRAEGVDDDKIVVLPCCVDLDKFNYDEGRRNALRRQYHLPDDSIIGIYAGKFGGIYYWEEAFKFYKEAFDFFGDRFRLVILSSQPEEEVRHQLTINSIDDSRVLIRAAPHNEVNDWLCAADFAFCSIKPAPSRLFCSPVKIGEYWACGLPVFLEPGIGDDSDIVESEGGGIIVRKENHVAAFREMQKILSLGRANLAAPIRDIALRHRHPRLISDVYEKVVLGYAK